MEDMLTNEILTTDARNHLSQAGKWAKIVGIVGMIFSCLMGLMALFFIFGMRSLSGYFNPLGTEEGIPGGASIVFGGIVYIIMAAVYFFMSLSAYRFGKLIKIGLQSDSSDKLTDSFKNLKNYFTINGVILIAAIAMSILGILMIGMLGFFMK